MKIKNKPDEQSMFPDAEQICAFLKKAGKPVKFETLFNETRDKCRNKKIFRAILNQLAESRAIIKLANNFWCIPETLKTVTGVFHAGRKGGVLSVADDNLDYRIKESDTGGAWDKDLARALKISSSPEPSAKIIEILHRNQKEVAARLTRKSGKHIVCRSIGLKIPVFFTIRPDFSRFPMKQLRHGQLALVRPEKPLPDGNWQAALIKIVREENTLAAQEALVKLNHDVPQEFPEFALEQAENLPQKPTLNDIKGRLDLRHLDFVTIDGADARDFDDAVYVDETRDGWVLHVAIADVSHYVRPDPDPDSLDAEAFRRGNSWYFPKSVNPMLPPKLSNGLCSLNPGEDRLAILVKMPFSRKGVPEPPEFAAIVMNSRARLTYDQVAEFFSGKNDAAPPELAPMLKRAFALYQCLAAKRHARGSIDFELPEAAYDFDDEGALTDIHISERNDAHKLIEEFMIAANEAVATWLAQKKLPFPYRTHPSPEPAKLLALFDILRKTAQETLPAAIYDANTEDPHVIQQILQKAAGGDNEYVVNRLCLRTMSQARYQPENEGHYALASPYYCHFTSPIRRYADLLAHRVLNTALYHGDANLLPDNERLWKITDHLNKRERSAMDCEREMAKRLACMLLSSRIGESMRGVISGVTDFGIFVEFKDIPAEGLIKIGELGADWFELDGERQMLLGRNTHKIYKLGQPLQVKILGVNEDRFEILLALADKSAKKNIRKTQARRRGNQQKKNAAPLTICPKRRKDARLSQQEPEGGGKRAKNIRKKQKI